jgi:RimJ/RimL family protein N-acetyltransferase
LKIVLKSQNIILTPSSFNDCKMFCKWESKEYVRKFFTMADSRDYEEIVREYVLRDEDPSKFQFTIHHSETNNAIGRIYISNFNEHEASIDITRIYIGEEAYLKKGYGEEALLILLDYFFNVLKLERVTIDFFEENERAHNLYKKLGFKSEGILRHVAKKNDTFINLHLMSMLREEYFSVSRKAL